MDVAIDRNPDVPLTLAVPQPDAKRSKPGDDIRLHLEKPSRPPPQPAAPTAPPKPVAPPPPRPAAPPPVARLPQKEIKQTFEDFANPRKLRPDRPRSPTSSEVSFPGGSDDGDAPYDPSEGSDGDDDEDDERPYSIDEPPEEEPEDALKPSEGFRTIDEEKASLIFKLARAKRAGMPSSRNFTMSADVRDMRAEMARIEHELALDGSLKFQRKMLMMTVSVVEHMNNRYDPFELQLNGWSESVHGSLGDYDRVFERLHEKYKSKVSMAPEIELLFMLAGSAMMFHFTKTIFKQGLPGMSANPELMQSMMKAFAQSQTPSQQQTKPSTGAPPPSAPQQPPSETQPPSAPGQRREMRGPAMDIGSILGGGGGGGALPFDLMRPPQIADRAMAPPAPPPKSVTFAKGTKRPAEGPPKNDGGDDAGDDEFDDRLSDIVSDPGSELESVPDDLSSFGSSSSEDGDIRTVPLTMGRGRGRGRGRGGGTGSKKAKTVISFT